MPEFCDIHFFLFLIDSSISQPPPPICILKITQFIHDSIYDISNFPCSSINIFFSYFVKNHIIQLILHKTALSRTFYIILLLSEILTELHIGYYNKNQFSEIISSK